MARSSTSTDWLRRPQPRLPEVRVITAFCPYDVRFVALERNNKSREENDHSAYWLLSSGLQACGAQPIEPTGTTLCEDLDVALGDSRGARDRATGVFHTPDGPVFIFDDGSVYRASLQLANRIPPMGEEMTIAPLDDRAVVIGARDGFITAIIAGPPPPPR